MDAKHKIDIQMHNPVKRKASKEKEPGNNKQPTKTQCSFTIGTPEIYTGPMSVGKLRLFSLPVT